MSKRKPVIIFDSQLFKNILTLEEGPIAGSKIKAFCQVPCLGRHRLKRNQTKEEVRVKNSEELEQNPKASYRNQSVGKSWGPYG